MYTYFLRSFADVQRLRRLAETLEADVRGPADVYKQIRAVLLESVSDIARDVFEEEYFIANPNSPPSREGYRLLRNVKGDIYEGERMTFSDFKKADLLLDLIKYQQITHWMHIPLRRDSDKSKQSAIVCARVENVPDHDLKLNEQMWEAILNEFDQVVADTVSKLSGQVVKGAIASYFIIFDDVKPALDCAVRLQKGVKDYNDILTTVRIPSPRITLDFGHVNRVMRSYGFDFIGQPISVCAKLVDQINDGEIFLTKTAEDNLPPASRNLYKFSNLSPRPLEEFGNVQVKKLDWE